MVQLSILIKNNFTKVCDYHNKAKVNHTLGENWFSGSFFLLTPKIKVT